MGSSAPKSETIVKGGKPTIVREYLSPEYLKKLSSLASYYGNRALQERSTYQNMVNTQRISQGQVPLFPTMTTTKGDVVAPGIVSTPFNTKGLVTAAQEGGMFQPPKRSGGKKNKEENETARSGYLDAVNASKTNAGTDLGL